MNPTSKHDAPSASFSSDLFGVMTHAGTMNVSDDVQVTGIFVAIPIEELREVKYLPMYARVAVLPADIVDDWTVRASDYDRLANAARALRSACKDRISPGHYAKLDEECREIDAILSSPNGET